MLAEQLEERNYDGINYDCKSEKLPYAFSQLDLNSDKFILTSMCPYLIQINIGNTKS